MRRYRGMRMRFGRGSFFGSNPHRLFRAMYYHIFILFAIMVGFFSPASAYIDFNTGSLIFQSLVALAIGFSYVFRTKLAALLQRLKKS